MAICPQMGRTIEDQSVFHSGEHLPEGKCNRSLFAGAMPPITQNWADIASAACLA